LAIAHEFGHVYLFAVDDPSHTAPEPKDRRAFLEWDARREEAVKHLLGRWKFDLAEHDRLETWGKGSDWGRSDDWLRDTYPSKSKPSSVGDHDEPGTTGTVVPG